MKIAYLVLCHKNEKHVNNLIASLMTPNTEFFIHIDKKTELNILKNECVHILDAAHRVNVSWGDVSIVDAMHKLISSAISFKKFDYYILLSGQDYPIKSNDDIYSFLKNNYGKEMISFCSTNINDKNYKLFAKRNDIKYTQFLLKNAFINKVIKKIYICITGGKYRTFFLKRKNKSYSYFYYGSQWWALTHEAVNLINVELDKKNWIKDDLKGCAIPDECIAQTILYNNRNKFMFLEGITYIEFKGTKRSPHILDETYYERLIKSNKLFARKFDTTVSDDLICKLDNINKVSKLEK